MIQIPFEKNDFYKWSELYRANSPQNRSVLNLENFTPENIPNNCLL